MSPERVIVFDTTLRDGEQSPGISLDTGEKITIAEQLARLNVDVIEAGFPVASQGDFESVEAIARKVKGPVICGLSRTALADVDRCWEALQDAEKSRIHVFIATSEDHMRLKLKKTPDQVKIETRQAIAHAKQYTADVEFSPEDASRSDFDFMCEVLQIAVDAGATTLNIPDTVGYGVPEEYGRRISDVRERVKGDYIISTHCHDDLGMAVANTLQAVKAGARQVEVTINGIGERAGNAALEEVVVAMDTRQDYYGTTTELDKTELPGSSRLVAKLTGYPVQFNKAVVGRNAFLHEAGIHQAGVLEDATLYEVVDAVSVGREAAEIAVGKHSGTHGVSSRLEVLGIKASNRKEISEACSRAGDQQKRRITDVEIEEIAEELVGNETPINDIDVLHIDLETHDDYSQATITLTTGHYEHVLKAENGGEIGAAMKAIQQVYPKYDLADWEAVKLIEEQGASSEGGATIEVRIPTGEVISSYFKGNNVVNASIKAIVRAINCGERIMARNAEQAEQS